MSEVMSNLSGVKTKIADALRAAKGDNGASAVLVAVVQEFDKKADKAMRQGDTPSAMREAVVELEQAGDSAKAAAEADSGLSAEATQAVIYAHMAICVLKGSCSG